MVESRGPVEITDLNRPYWDALDEGRLTFQQCLSCSHAWLPVRAECPVCLQADWRWEPAAGTGKVVSWIIYHTAYDEAWKDRIPYNVAIVALDEGPRLVTNLVGVGHGEIVADLAVRLAIERRDGIALACFTPDRDDVR